MTLRVTNPSFVMIWVVPKRVNRGERKERGCRRLVMEYRQSGTKDG